MTIPPKREKRDETLGIRVSASDKARAELLSRHAGADDVSKYLRPVLLRFLAEDQRRLNISEAQLSAEVNEFLRRLDAMPRKKGNQGR